MTIDPIKAERLREARTKAGYDSAQAAAEAFGWGVAGYRHHENGTRNFGPDKARKYARAFRVKLGWLMHLGNIDGDAPSDYIASERLMVGGTVAAGVWREANDEFPNFEIETAPIIENAKRFGLVVEGYSMDLVYEPGTILECVSIFTNGVTPESGDHVIAQRIRPDGLRETTVKEFVRKNGANYLVPRSSKPEHQSEIELGNPDDDMDPEGEQVTVIGFVVNVIPPRVLRLLERMNKVHRFSNL